MAINFEENLHVVRWLHDNALEQGMQDNNISNGFSYSFSDDRRNRKIFQIQVGNTQLRIQKRRGFVLLEYNNWANNPRINQEIQQFRSALDREGIPLDYPNPPTRGYPSITLERIAERNTYLRFQELLNSFLDRIRPILI